MTDSNINTITIIGAGNVGSQLCEKLANCNFMIDGLVYNRNKPVEKLKKITNTFSFQEIDKISSHSDLYIIAVNDDQYQKVISTFPLKDKFIIHTSGSFESHKLEKITERWGCLYPLQTINKKKEIDWNGVNFFIEASKKNDLLKIKALCEKTGFRYHLADSKKREKLHIAAVLINNFTYHLLSSAKAFCEKNNIDYNYFQDLLFQSIKNVQDEDAFQLQTGPAKRKDLDLIKKQLELLENEESLKEIYDLFSQQIIQKHHNEL